MDAINNQLLSIAQNQPYPLLFATISGSHLYGFPSADSDYDLRGVHILPLPDVIGLITGEETVEIVQANLVTLNQHFQLPQIPDLIACKLAGVEKSAIREAIPAGIADSEMAFHQQEYQ